MPLSTGRLLALLSAFGLWIAVGALLLPVYSKVLVSVVSVVLGWIQPHGIDLRLIDEYPWLGYRFSNSSGGPDYGRVPLDLFVYNSALYLALVTALPGLTVKGRLVFAVTAAPAVFLFHLTDLTLAIDGQVSSLVRPQHANVLQDFSLWYSLVKLYNHMSIMAIKQVVLVGLFYLQWILLPRWVPEVRRAAP